MTASLSPLWPRRVLIETGMVRVPVHRAHACRPADLPPTADRDLTKLRTRRPALDVWSIVR